MSWFKNAKLQKCNVTADNLLTIWSKTMYSMYFECTLNVSRRNLDCFLYENRALRLLTQNILMTKRFENIRTQHSQCHFFCRVWYRFDYNLIFNPLKMVIWAWPAIHTNQYISLWQIVLANFTLINVLDTFIKNILYIDALHTFINLKMISDNECFLKNYFYSIFLH